MNKLRNKYPRAIIPKDTILFRKALDNNIYETMFFGLDSYAAHSSDHSYANPMQIWMTNQQIESSLIVKGKKTPYIYENDLEHCYREFCGEELYYLDIKHRDNPKRPLFLDFLKKNQIDTWITSTENKTPLELFLFTNDNRNLVRFVQFAEPNDTLLDMDAFSNIKLIDPIKRTALPDMYVKRL